MVIYRVGNVLPFVLFLIQYMYIDQCSCDVIVVTYFKKSFRQ